VAEESLTEEAVLEKPAAEELSAEAAITDVAVTDLMRAAQVLSSAPPNAYFVQHIVLSSELAAKAYVSRYPILGDAAVVPLRLSQKNAYGVVSGPFTTRAAAALFTQDSAVPDDYWIRSAAQLQAILRR
ncbi:MAG: SPOR domain-containing protein, partial [Porticoccaceae bacterium]|nr:SPOR domain-containing protein [Porticoccaceae bacterium]